MTELERRIVLASMHYCDAVLENGYDSAEAKRRYKFLEQAYDDIGLRLDPPTVRRIAV
jgi:hypothetical protein